MAVRLGKSGLLKMSPPALRSLEKVLGFFNTNTITRTFAKVALSRGTLKAAWVNPVLIPAHGKASIGSVLSLMGEIIEGEKKK